MDVYLQHVRPGNKFFWKGIFWKNSKGGTFLKMGDISNNWQLVIIKTDVNSECTIKYNQRLFPISLHNPTTHRKHLLG